MDTMIWVVLFGVLALAIVMGVLAARLLRSDRERTEARAAMLRQLAFEPEPPINERAFQAPSAASFEPAFGATVDRTPAPTRRLMAVAVVIVFMAVGAASVYGIYGDDGGAANAGGGERPKSAAARRGEVLPLELLSLTHRTDAGDFIVTGLVQNPSEGRPAPSVMAVVYVFNAQGEYFASGKATLEFSPLAPGAESPFVVRLPKISGVTRYRIGFRAPDGSVVAHVDKRGQPLGGTTGGTTSTSSSQTQSGGL
jgi:hypothetical protein